MSDPRQSTLHDIRRLRRLNGRSTIAGEQRWYIGSTHRTIVCQAHRYSLALWDDGSGNVFYFHRSGFAGRGIPQPARGVHATRANCNQVGCSPHIVLRDRKILRDV